MLKIRCSFHPHYRALLKSRSNCETCNVLYALAHPSKGSFMEILNALGSKLATEEGKDDLWIALEGLEGGRKSELRIKCRRHHYKALRKPGWNCGSCWLLYVLKYQMHHKEGEKRLGSLNPYPYLIGHVDLWEACENMKITRITKSTDPYHNLTFFTF